MPSPARRKPKRRKKKRTLPDIRPLSLLSIPLILGVAAAAAASEATAPEPTRTPFPSRTPVPAPSVTPTYLPSRTPTPTQTRTPTATPSRPPAYRDWAVDRFGPPWRVDCEDEQTWNGYDQGDWANNFCTPGLITYEAAWYEGPRDFYGLMSSYAEGVMEAQLRYRDIPEGKYLDGVALMSCADIGETVWLRRPGMGWEGPFISVDCSQHQHAYYHQVGLGLAVEVGYKTTVEWGAKILQRIDVHIGGGPPGAWDGPRLADWWVTNALQWQMPEG